MAYRAGVDVRAELERERERVVHRLASMPLVRATGCVELVHTAAMRLVELAGERDPADLPVLAPQGLAAQVAVVSADLLALPDDADRDAAALAVLTELRRALPL